MSLGSTASVNSAPNITSDAISIESDMRRRARACHVPITPYRVTALGRNLPGHFVGALDAAHEAVGLGIELIAAPLPVEIDVVQHRAQHGHPNAADLARGVVGRRPDARFGDGHGAHDGLVAGLIAIPYRRPSRPYRRAWSHRACQLRSLRQEEHLPATIRINPTVSLVPMRLAIWAEASREHDGNRDGEQRMAAPSAV